MQFKKYEVFKKLLKIFYCYFLLKEILLQVSTWSIIIGSTRKSFSSAGRVAKVAEQSEQRDQHRADRHEDIVGGHKHGTAG